MSKVSLLERLKSIKSRFNSNETKAKDVRTYKPFPNKIRQSLKRMMTTLRTAALATTLSVLSIPAIPKTYDSSVSETMKETSWEKSIDVIVNKKTQQLQQQIMQNIDSLQQKIIQARRTGKREQVVREIFNKVYPKGGLTGKMNYCVAGAMYAQSLCNDNILKQILPDAHKTPKDYKYSSHPNVSCPYMRSFFKENMPQNYAERGDENFKETLSKLEAGDIITVFSSVNTSSREHCVTCAGPVKDGKIPVKSFNSERNYEVPVSKVVGAALVMEQYRETLTQELYQDRAATRYAVIDNIGNNTIDFSSYVESSLPQKIKARNQRG